MPWISGAILILRVVIIFAPQYTSRWHLLPLFIFPLIVKIARAVLIIIFIVEWKRRSVQNQFQATAQLDTWVVKSSWILEMVDNGKVLSINLRGVSWVLTQFFLYSYISLLFLWRLSARAHIFDRSKTGAVKEQGGTSLSVSSPKALCLPLCVQFRYQADFRVYFGSLVLISSFLVGWHHSQSDRVRSHYCHSDLQPLSSYSALRLKRPSPSCKHRECQYIRFYHLLCFRQQWGIVSSFFLFR